MENECAHCLESVTELSSNGNDSYLEDTRRLFHQPCPQCDLSENQQDHLCTTCQHLRLNHLVHCVPLDIRRRFLFDLRPKQTDGQNSSACALCRLVQHMISVAFGENAIAEPVPDDWSIPLFLGSELDRSCTTTADIYLQSQVEGEGSSNTWIGDLHISSMSNGSIDKHCVGGNINWQHMRNAMDHCTEHHHKCRRKGNADLPIGFQLIDVARRSIVETNNVPFMALSYVWGKDTRSSLLTATRSTISDYGKEGGLAAVDMPKTIEDAMQICVELGINYLWADRLCIIQDNPEDKMHQIMAMNDIYEKASLVLVSAYGDNMDFGIYGISRSRSMTQRQEDVHGLRLTNLVREEAEDTLALWQTRGWTYQEAVCARRRFHFTKTRAYYECQTSTYYEDMYSATKEVDESSAYALHVDHEQSVFEAFTRHLAEYTSRTLKFSSDVYNAFIGIANLLYKSEHSKSFLYGLPRTDFDRALRWYTSEGAKPTPRVETSNLMCPSWSWASAMVQGEQVRYQDTAFYGPLAIWATEMQDFERVEMAADEGWQTYMELAKQKGCSLHSTDQEVLQDTDQLALQEATYCLSLSKHISDPCRRPSHDHTRGLKEFGPGYILAVAQVASFRLGPRGSSNWGLFIVDSADMKAGELCGEVAHFREAVLASAHRGIQYEFVALSLSGLRIRRQTGEEWETKNYHDQDGTPLDTLPIVNVLLLERKGEVVYRKEIGWIYLKDWTRADRHWETVVLG